MWFVLIILIFIVIFAVLANIEDSEKVKSTNNVVSTNIKSNNNNTVIIKPISQYEPDVIKAKQIYQQAINLYRINNTEESVKLFKQSANILEPLKSKYPYSLEVNFYLLECYEGFNRNKAIDSGYKCIKIIELASDKEYRIAISTYYDVNRKLYKLLIMEDKITEAKTCLRKVMELAHIILEAGKANLNESLKTNLRTEGLIAIHFLQQIINGNNIKNNLTTGVDSPEMWYFFDRRNSPQDALILEQLHNIGLFIFG